MNIKLSSSSVAGTVQAPASKSSAQRLLLMSISKPKTIIKDLGEDADTQSMLSVLKHLPLKLIEKGNDLIITSEWTPNNENLSLWTESIEVNVGESGFGLRTLMFVLPIFSKQIRILKEGSLGQRDISEIKPVFEQLGFQIEDNESVLQITGSLDLARIKSLKVWPSLQSSQYLTGYLILLTLLMDWQLLNVEDVAFEIEEIKSLPYVTQTIEHLEMAGHVIPEFEDQKISFKKRKVNAKEWIVDKDWSSAALLLAAGVATDQEFVVAGLDLFKTQADQKVLEALQDMGIQMSIRAEEIELRRTPKKYAFQLDATHSPDLFPALAVMAASCEGTSVIHGVHRLYNKESNRAEAIVESFNALGIEVILQDDMMIVKGGQPKGGVVDSYNDHRMAMALCVLAMRSEEEVCIENIEVVNKSYPSFFEDLKELGLEYEINH